MLRAWSSLLINADNCECPRNAEYLPSSIISRVGLAHQEDIREAVFTPKLAFLARSKVTGQALQHTLNSHPLPKKTLPLAL